MCIDVEGYLRQFNTKRAQKKNLHIYQTLLLARAQKKEVIPMGDACYRFSYKKGCKGHIISLMPTDSMMEAIESELLNLK